VSTAGETELDLDALNAWIGGRRPGVGQRFMRVRIGAETGIDNALYLIERAGHRWVLRRPPL
jgi:aminoglycoside phosphotransferase (APT) family kinase protein